MVSTAFLPFSKLILSLNAIMMFNFECEHYFLRFRHRKDGAYANYHLAAQVGPIKHRPNASQMTKDFNELVLALFNFGSGNMAKYKNILSW